MATANETVSVTNDYLKITIAGYQLKIAKVLETHDNFKDFLTSLDFEED